MFPKIDPADRALLALPSVGQIGVVVKDINPAMAFYSDVMSVGPFKIFEPESDKLRDVDELVIFSSDQILGDLESPFVFEAMAIGDELVPYSFYLRQNYPNPFNPNTIIEYGIPKDSKVELVIYNILGQKIKTLVNKRQPAKRYKIEFNAAETLMASGIYFYQINAGNFTKRYKMVYIK